MSADLSPRPQSAAAELAALPSYCLAQDFSSQRGDRDRPCLSKPTAAHSLRASAGRDGEWGNASESEARGAQARRGCPKTATRCRQYVREPKPETRTGAD